MSRDLLNWGVSWLQNTRKRQANQRITLSWTTYSVTLDATLVPFDTSVLRGKTNQRSHYQSFLIAASEIPDTIKIHPGLIITWAGRKFELIVDRDGESYLNDPYKKDIVLNCIEIQ